MSAFVLFVSLNQSFDPSASLPQLEPWVERGWALTVTKVKMCDRVVAVFQGAPVAAWRVRGAFPTDLVYRSSDGTLRARAGLSVGDPLPILQAYNAVPALRRGAAVVELDIEALASER